jgi:hypothetical protein
VNLPPDLVVPKVESLLSCLEEKLSEYDAEVCRSFIAPGSSSPWDVCCDCGRNEGMAWIAIQEVYPTDNFPTSQTGAMRCTFAEHGVRVTLNVLRCAAVVDDQGRVPSTARLMNDMRKVQRDRTIVLEAIKCCFLADADPGTYVIGSFTPLGPSGGCVGGSTSLSFAVPACRCPEPVGLDL